MSGSGSESWSGGSWQPPAAGGGLPESAPPAAAWQSGPVWGAPRPPEVKPGVVPLRPLGLGELLDGALAVVRGYPRPALGIAALVALVSGLVSLLLSLTVLRPLAALNSTALGGDDSLRVLRDTLGAGAAASTAGGVLAFVAGAVLTGGIAALCGRAVLGQPMTFGEMWATVRPRLGALLGATLLSGLLSALPFVVGVLLAVVLGLAGGLAGGLVGGLLLAPLGAAGSVWLYVRFCLAPAVVVLEKQGVRAALRRSAVLVRGSFWRLLWILLLTYVLAAVISAIIQVPLAFLGGNPFNTAGGAPSTTQVVVSAVAGALAATVVGPFRAAVAALLYVDRRMRAEGLDVALAAALTDRP